MMTEALNLIVLALDFAAKKHRDQRRKDHAASPYINHPIALVKVLVTEAQITNEVVLVSALLHDTVEDTDTTFDEIEHHFGPAIASIVREVTDDTSLPRLERKAQQILHASHLSKEATLVKLADKISNLRDLIAALPLHWSLKRKRDYCEWAKKVVSHIQNPHPTLLALFEQTAQELSESLAVSASMITGSPPSSSSSSTEAPTSVVPPAIKSEGSKPE